MTKNPFENPDADFYGKKVKDYKIPERKEKPKPAEPLEKKVGSKTLKKKDGKLGLCIEFKKYCLKGKSTANAINRIFDEYGSDITIIERLKACTIDYNIKVYNSDILKAMKKGKKFTHYCDTYPPATIKAERSGTSIWIFYERGGVLHAYSSIKANIRGKEREVKKEHETLCKLLGKNVKRFASHYYI